MRESVLNAKKENVQEIQKNIENAQAVVLVDYRGLNVSQLTELREKYREAGVEYKVYKNTMMRFAFKEAGLEDFNKNLTGPNAVAFGYDDPVAVAKITSDFAKEHEQLEIKAGIVDGKIIDLAGVNSLASLPSKEQLLGQVVRGLNSPIQGFANVLTGNLRGLVTALAAIRDQKQA